MNTHVFDMRFEPQHPNHCHHKPEDYIGSIRRIICNEGTYTEKWYDVYIYTDKCDGELSVCIRDGEDGDYWSAGSLLTFLTRAHARPEYTAALEVIKYKGKIVFERNKK